MITHPIPKLIRDLSAVGGGLALFTWGLQAAPFLYSSGDLVLSFRQTGSASDYVVNIGKASAYATLATNSTIVITNLSTAQLDAAFPTVNGIAWSAAAAVRAVGDTNYPFETIWVTAPRGDITVQSTPWLRKGQFVQGNGASQIDAVGNDAAAASSSLASGTNNTAASVVIPVNSGYDIAPILGAGSNYANTFQGSVENITPPDFDSQAQNVSRSDLYELVPGAVADGTLNAPGRYLGYFELKPDGTLSFSNGIPAQTQPTIASIQRTGTAITISFSSSNNVTYSLRSTDAAGLSSPISTWSTGPSIAGNGSELSLQVTNTANTGFFVLVAKP